MFGRVPIDFTLPEYHLVFRTRKGKLLSFVSRATSMVVAVRQVRAKYEDELRNADLTDSYVSKAAGQR